MPGRPGDLAKVFQNLRLSEAHCQLFLQCLSTLVDDDHDLEGGALRGAHASHKGLMHPAATEVLGLDVHELFGRLDCVHEEVFDLTDGPVVGAGVGAAEGNRSAAT